MKKIRIKTIGGLCAMAMIVMAGTNSCGDSFLDEVNHHSQSAEEYYATKLGYEALIYGCYSRMRSLYNDKSYISLGQLGTDLFTQNNTIGLSTLNQYPTTYDANEGSVNSLWENLYSSLKDVNAALDRADDVILLSDDPDGLDVAVLNQRVAEMRAMRALLLFEIVRNWGQGPLMLQEPLAPTKTAEMSDAPAFYNAILSDLEVAIDSLPMRQTGDNYGRFSKAAAKHLRSLVYLTRGYETFGEATDFTNAFADAEDVIKNSGHKLLDDYLMVHKQSNEINDEIVMSIGFSTTKNNNVNNWPKYFLFPYREGWDGLGFDKLYGNDDVIGVPTKFAYLMYDWQKDRRPSVSFMSPLNGDANTSVDGRVSDNGAKLPAGKNWFEAIKDVEGKYVKGDTVIYFPVPTDINFKHWTDAEKAKASFVVYNFPSGDPTEVTDADDYYKLGYQSTNTTTRAFLPVWKFKDKNTIYDSGNAGTGTRDIYVFRLAETYLIASEAAVKKGDNANALKYINDIVKRAKLKAPQAGLAEYAGTVTIDNVLDERAKELLGEVPRWYDLQRTGKLAERVLKYNWDVTHISGNIQTQLSQTSFEQKFKLRPIPLKWLNSLSNGQELGNNPGWE